MSMQILRMPVDSFGEYELCVGLRVRLDMLADTGGLLDARSLLHKVEVAEHACDHEHDIARESATVSIPQIIQYVP